MIDGDSSRHGGFMAKAVRADVSSARKSDDCDRARISAHTALDELRRSLEPAKPLRHRDGWSQKRLRRLIEALGSTNPYLF